MLTNLSASLPKRSANFAQPVCGFSDTSITAEPIDSRVPGGRLSTLISRSMMSWSPASCHRSFDCASIASDAGIHYIELSGRIRAAVRRASAPARLPTVTNEANVDVELAGRYDFAFIDGGTLHDHPKRATISRRAPDLFEAGLQLVYQSGGWLLLATREHS